MHADQLTRPRDICWALCLELNTAASRNVGAVDGQRLHDLRAMLEAASALTDRIEKLRGTQQ